MKQKDASFKMLIKMCEQNGWENGINYLKQIVYKTELRQADLFAGNFAQQKEARKMSKTIIRQNITIAKLNEYRKEHNL